MPIHPPTREELLAADCWFPGDRVGRDEATTAWKRFSRLRQAGWRLARDLPIGAEPYDGRARKRPAVPVGSRIELERATQRGENFLTDHALAAVRHRIANPEPRQMLSTDRLWADLLSSMPLCFNLFGEAWADPARARAAVEALHPGAPPGDVAVRFEHSPGRGSKAYLGNLTAFDAAFEVDLGGGAAGILGVETKYHEHGKPEQPPREAALARYAEVTERSGAFAEGWRERLVGTALQQVWQDHLLVLAMLQHPSGRWRWGRFVLIAPRENASFQRIAAEYRGVLRDPSTFAAISLEDIVAAPGVMSDGARAAFGERYLP